MEDTSQAGHNSAGADGPGFDLPLTRREQALPPPTTREGIGAGGAGLLMLPDSLRAELRIVRELAGGGEADVVLVEDAAARQWVVKIYRSSAKVDAGAAARLIALDRTFLVAPLRTGFDNGRHWELMEYVPGGSLAELTAGGSGALVAAPDIAETVRQLTEALAELHRAQITHSDLKPANVLVRQARPLRLALTDFGLSKYLADASKRFTRLGYTAAYAPPESFAGLFSPAQDWWALGMIVRELATGEPPFAGLADQVIMHELMVRDVPLDAVADDRARLLCRGLLIRDPSHRWAEPQVRAWLAGDAPAVHTVADVRAGHALVVAGERCYTRAEAARAFTLHWDIAQETFLTRISTRGETGEGWRLLRSWLDQFDQDVEQRARLIDQVLTADVPPGVRMVHLLRWLDPSLPPMYRGRQLRPEHVPAASADARLVQELWSPEHRLLELLAQFEGGADLAAVDRRWRNAMAQLAAVATTPMPPAARQAVAAAATEHRAALLRAAGDPTVAPALAAHAAQARARVRPVPSWFAPLDRVEDPAVALVVVTVAAVAEVDAREAQERIDRPRVLWAQEERRRIAGRPRALGFAAAAVAVWGAVLVTGACAAVLAAPVFGLGAPSGTATATGGTSGGAGDQVGLVAVFGALFLACAGAEGGLAVLLGAYYHPSWSAWTKLGQLWRRLPDAWDAARRTGNALRGMAAAAPPVAGCLCCLACFMSGTIAALLGGAYAITVIGASAGHLVWSAVRLARFTNLRNRRRGDLLGNVSDQGNGVR